MTGREPVRILFVGLDFTGQGLVLAYALWDNNYAVEYASKRGSAIINAKKKKHARKRLPKARAEPRSGASIERAESVVAYCFSEVALHALVICAAAGGYLCWLCKHAVA